MAAGHDAHPATVEANANERAATVLWREPENGKAQPMGEIAAALTAKMAEDHLA